VGDYNGDGADDVLVKANGEEIRFVILAGSRAWDLAAPSVKPPIPETYSFKAYPNPFNSTIQIDLTFQGKGGYRAEIFDVSGRKVGSLFDGNVTAGSYSFDWKAPAAGVYLVSLSSDKGRLQTLKIVAMP